ncbi:MAG: iron ABC transporter permease [Synergistaceae bacterium]|jgi:iron complex transport system permease protein|nr:iron ABC transporter permease [Synergistaceae bacterium]
MSVRTKLAIIILLGIAALLIAPFAGPRWISPSEIFGAASSSSAFGAAGLANPERVFWELRVPRVILAWLCGATLGLCGMLFQALFRNPLAEPTMLGVSSGASFGAALCIYAGWSFSLFGAEGMTVCAFAGALLCVAALHASSRPDDPNGVALLLAGVAFNFFFSSLVMILQYVGDYHDSFRLLRWTLGGIQAIGIGEAIGLFPAFALAAAVSVFHAGELDLMLCGPEIAIARGVALGRTRVVLFLSVSFCVAMCVAFCGPIAFVGLMVPHLCRMMVGVPHLRLSIASAAFGGAFLTLCDTAARTLWAPIELPVGIITSFLGAPFFLWLLSRRRV